MSFRCFRCRALVFKTAVVFVCKDGSKQKKKMVRFHTNEKLCSLSIYRRSQTFSFYSLDRLQGGSHRASVSSDDKDPFRFRHMIPTDTLQVRSLANAGEFINPPRQIGRVFNTGAHVRVLTSDPDGESAAVCEIVHTKSESEGRPERTFQLCCR